MHWHIIVRVDAQLAKHRCIEEPNNELVTVAVDAGYFSGYECMLADEAGCLVDEDVLFGDLAEVGEVFAAA